MAMTESRLSIAQVLRQDKRYKIEAYAFVFEALRYAHEVLGMGGVAKPEPTKSTEAGGRVAKEPATERHLTGQELCEGIRQYALEQYGFMARSVLESWGVRNTGDFGEIVFNLIRAGEMRKTDSDRREDFDDVFDFEVGLRDSFEIKPPVERPKPPTG
jgi:uncharacterized repeat protein (TIGR04138 family)